MMANEYKLSYTAQEIDEKLGSVPDWNQNDNTAVDYIQNRPFYEADLDYLKLLPNQKWVTTHDPENNSTTTTTETIGDVFIPYIDLIADQTYNVSFVLDDGRNVNMELTAKYLTDDYIDFVGYDKIVAINYSDKFENGYDGLDFTIYNNFGINSDGTIGYVEGSTFYTLVAAQSATIQGIASTEIKKIDTKFINTSSGITENSTSEEIATAKSVYDLVQKVVQEVLYVDKGDTI